MKTTKVLFSTLIATSILFSTGCSSNTNVQSLNTLPIEQKISSNVSTELADMSEQEVKEMNQLLANENLDTKSFNVKEANEGKDVSIDLFLMNPKAAKRAKFWFIKNPNKLLDAGSSPRKRWFLERKLGGLFPSEAFKVQVLFWVDRADLLRVEKVTVDDSFLLVMAGVTSTPHLARFNNIIDQAALKVQLTLLAFQYGMPIPSLDEVKDWTQNASRLAPVIY